MDNATPISDFRQKKLIFIFENFFDVNHSGSIERKDFDQAVDYICGRRGWEKDSNKYNDTRERFIQIWDALRCVADANTDDQVSQEEWCRLWRTPSDCESWQNTYQSFMFYLLDTSGDGSIDVDEFTSVCSTYGVSPDECRGAYKKLSKDGTVKVDKPYYSVLWKDFFFSDDTAALGNFIFGKINF
ncbi:calexcitin-1 [Folsomia candida]|uniref:Calexcitin-2 n=1 Tax=Folsomia candida TaxID=158441 RepID=A0A226E4S6_FOLCA|nr:calexcitin-1 [Folsomia candida]XP_021955912.1 calexcitin-1 [Folsomia candida]XP_035709599.1 calexcitin-1 [Folsomia candida]OXA52280.1 Calexcitin-2 [Folsomia candida]